MRSLALISICLLAAVPAPAEQGFPYGLTPPDPTVKDDRLTDLLFLPGYQVDTLNADGLTTIFSVHNHSDRAATVLVEYFGTAGNLLADQELELQGKQTRSIDVRNIRGLGSRRRAVRGRIEITQTGGGSPRGRSDLTGDYFFLDPAGNFATGDQLLRREDYCNSLMVRLLDFGSGAKLRLFSNAPRGQKVPTATFIAYNEAGAEVDRGEVFMNERIEVFNARELTSARFGTLELDFIDGGGSLSVEYSAAGRFSVAMNASCIGIPVRLDDCGGRRCPPADASLSAGDPRPALKDDRLAELLHLPSFEVDRRSGRLTTLFSVHNDDDSPVDLRARYLDTAGDLVIEQEIRLIGKQTRTVDLRNLRRLPVDRDGIARGRVELIMEMPGLGRPSALTGDYFFLDVAGNSATGDQLMRREDHCDSLMVRLLDFGGGTKLRLFSNEPQGDAVPTAMVTVYNEAGAEVGGGPLFVDEEVEILDSRDLTPVRFGTLAIDYLEGGGSLVVEYSAAGRFSAAMNATCTGRQVRFEECTSACRG